MRVYYCSEMTADEPNALMPTLIINDWILHGIPMEQKAPIALTTTDIALAHSKKYVDDILNCKTDNGLGNKSKAIAKTLQYSVAALYRAASWVLHSRSMVAVSLGGGSPHAGYDYGKNGSTFNSLIVAALKLEAKGLVRRVGILDLCTEYGEGTYSIISKLKLKWIKYFSAGHAKPEQSELFLTLLPNLIKQNFCEKKKDILLINFGVCDWLTPEQHVKRDRIIFETCKKLKLPLAWTFTMRSTTPNNSAYTVESSIEMYRNTMLTCVNTWR